MTPFHSTAADSTSVRAMEKQILPVPQPQRQREAKTPWDAHCPAQPPSCALQRDIVACFRSSLQHGTQGVSQCFGGSFADLQHKGAKAPLDWECWPVAWPRVLPLVWSHGATSHGSGGIDGHVWFPVFVGECGWCCYSSMSLETQLGGDFLGRGMVEVDKGELFFPDISLQPFSSRSCAEDRFIYHVLSVFFCQNRRTKIS